MKLYYLTWRDSGGQIRHCWTSKLDDARRVLTLLQADGLFGVITLERPPLEVA